MASTAVPPLSVLFQIQSPAHPEMNFNRNLAWTSLEVYRLVIRIANIWVSLCGENLNLTVELDFIHLFVSQAISNAVSVISSSKDMYSRGRWYLICILFQSLES